VLLRSNETALYSTKDIGLAILKQKEFAYDKSLYIVATEQIHHFNQLFKTLELIGFDGSGLQHISYGMVEATDGKMSSRKGNSISYYQARDAIIAKAKEMIQNRNIDEHSSKSLCESIGF
jgi:arginyl-tRNA synthetase